MRHVAPSLAWFIVRDPEALSAALVIEGLRSESLDGAFPGYVRPRPPSPPHPADDGIEAIVADFGREERGIIPLEQRHDLSPDDMAAIRDALAANARENAGHLTGPGLYGDGEDLYAEDEVGFGMGGGYGARLHDLALMAGIQPLNGPTSPRLQQLPTSITVINNVLDSEGAARRVFAEQRRRDDILRQNGGPRSANLAVAATRRGNVGSIARQRIADNANRAQITRAVKKPESRKLLETRKEDPDIEAMPTTAADNTCTVCLFAHTTTMCIPCCHWAYCKRCAETWKKTSDKCPVCNAKIESVVQPRPIFNAQEEHRQRQKDPKYLLAVADKLQKDVDDMRARAKEMMEKGQGAAAAEECPVATVEPPPPVAAAATSTVPVASPPSPSLPVLPRRMVAPRRPERMDVDEDGDSFIDDADDDEEDDEDVIPYNEDEEEHPVLCNCAQCEDEDEDVIEVPPPPPPSSRKRAAPSSSSSRGKKKKEAKAAPKKAGPKRRKPAVKASAAPKRKNAKVAPAPHREAKRKRG